MERLRGLSAALLIVAISLLGVACQAGANVDVGGEGGEGGGSLVGAGDGGLSNHGDNGLGVGLDGGLLFRLGHRCV